ncbi:DUF6270 domain-containing protein [Cytobacillus kochii]|uniref:DUF6270 domain-containing protein n=1 Tax=Cytobacillus kochii TaxID=859143 RepID=UPI00248007CB|nr:DUF6270 domain-containing protein [Cytobacillus kochii]
MTIKISTLGCCATRDNFNSKFIKNYKDFYTLSMHQNQMSMISLASKSVPFSPVLVDNVLPHEKRHFETELDKSFYDSMLLNEPDYLIIDFYGDIFFGTREINDSYITNKRWLFSKTSLYKQLREGNELTIFKDSKSYLRMWKEGISYLFDFLSEKLPNCKVIINKARFTDNYIDKDTGEQKLITESGKHRPIDIELYNKWWATLDDYIIENYNVRYIDYGNYDYMAVDDHPWGLFYLHFEQRFYDDFTQKLLTIILNDLKQENLSLKKLSGQNQKNNWLLNRNLIYNSDFKYGRNYWTYWQNDFKITVDDEENNILCVSLKQEGNDNDVNKQIWSNSIEINADGTREFILSFDIKVDDISKVDSHAAIFSVRTYNRSESISQSESAWFKNILLDDVQGIHDKEWINYSVTIKPFTGKFIKVGPYLFRNGTVSWKNIKLIKN